MVLTGIDCGHLTVSRWQYSAEAIAPYRVSWASSAHDSPGVRYRDPAKAARVASCDRFGRGVLGWKWRVG
jgi:hypothetical protein